MANHIFDRCTVHGLKLSFTVTKSAVTPFELLP
jgi:hypothetical protein